MSNTLWIDTETTGFSPEKNDVVQCAMLLEIDGVIAGEYMFRMQPHSFEHVKEEALAVNGLTIEELQGYLEPNIVQLHISNVIDMFFASRRAKEIAGYNIGFDIRMLKEFFKKCGDAPFFEQEYNCTDVMSIIKSRGLGLENNKLETVCAHFGIEYAKHTALGDIKATRELYRRLMNIEENPA